MASLRSRLQALEGLDDLVGVVLGLEAGDVEDVALGLEAEIADGVGHRLAADGGAVGDHDGVLACRSRR